MAITPGFLRSERMLELFEVTPETWKDGAAKDPHFAWSESPAFVGRGLAALAADPDRARFGGQALSSGTLGRVYDLRDADGSQPDFPGRAITTLIEDLSGIDPASLSTVEELVAACGPMGAPFAGLIGIELLARLQAGDDVETAVRATLHL